jgi:hypothetical protein
MYAAMALQPSRFCFKYRPWRPPQGEPVFKQGTQQSCPTFLYTHITTKADPPASSIDFVRGCTLLMFPSFATLWFSSDGDRIRQNLFLPRFDVRERIRVYVKQDRGGDRGSPRHKAVINSLALAATEFQTHDERVATSVLLFHAPLDPIFWKRSETGR